METKPFVDGLTIGEVLEQTVAAHGDHDAVVFPQLNLRWTYAEFLDRVKRMGRALMALGIQSGDHVGIWSTNWPEWLLAQFSTAYIGAVLVNVNPAYRLHELDYILRVADIKVLLLTDTFKHSNYESMMADLVPELAAVVFDEQPRHDRFPLLENVISIKNAPAFQGIWPWNEFISQAHQVHEAQLLERTLQIRFNMPANIQYTSGTTGNPKGATLSHRNLLMNAFYIGQRQHFTENDRVCIPVPFYHCFGCVLATMTCVIRGAAMVIPAESFDPQSALAAVEKERCTALYGVPTMFNAELNLPNFDEYDLSTLRTGIMAGSPCPIEVMKRVVRDMHLSEITIAYGMTETAPVSCQSSTDTPLDKRVSTVGQVQPHLEVKIVDPQSGDTVAPGETGELCTRGYSVMHGYWGDAEKTHEAIDAEGWMHTGDLAVMDSEGYVNIVGRIKDMVIRGGENIYPREVEEFLYRHPMVQDVQVVGVPDPKYGEELCAWIIPKTGTAPTEDDIREFCKGQIAHYKIPRYIRFVPAFPMTITGKVQKFKIRETMQHELGLHPDRTA